ncbi:MAG: hypothetical protein ABJ269_07435 [Parasphingorhabdus sp.]|uniref:hypothetical protein n=1 Tax=Parasphingorhabdus sp. TaxID=2709688 RepID=UPI003262F635
MGLIDWSDLASLFGIILLALVFVDLTGLFTIFGDWLMTENSNGDKHRGFVLWLVSGALVGSILPLAISAFVDGFDLNQIKYIGGGMISGIVGAVTFRMVWFNLERRYGESW